MSCPTSTVGSPSCNTGSPLSATAEQRSSSKNVAARTRYHDPFRRVVATAPDALVPSRIIATVTRTYLVDDIDGSTEAVTTIRFDFGQDQLRDRPQRNQRGQAGGPARRIPHCRHSRQPAAHLPPYGHA